MKMVIKRIPISTFKNRTFCLIFKVIMIGSFVIYAVLYGFACITALSKKSSSSEFPTVEIEDGEIAEHWSWECQNYGCVRASSNKPSVKLGSLFSTIEECRLVCLPYSTVWPQPTGIFKISRETRNIDAAKFKCHVDSIKDSDAAQKLIKENCDRILVNDLIKLCQLESSIGHRQAVKHPTGSHQYSDISPDINISFNISSPSNLKLDWSTDEKYMLAVSSTTSDIQVTIIANTVFGARHALQTLSQLVTCKKEFNGQNLIIMTDAKITDNPVYVHRGLLLDTARSFVSVKSILRTLDGMASSKLNVFHWHLTDSQSFPFFSRRVPNFSGYGAYSLREIYRPKDIKTIRDHAYSRGIRIIVEIDAPAHAGYGWQWGEKSGIGQLAVCIGKEPWSEYCIQPPCGQLNPVNPHIYAYLEALYKDLRDQFPQDMFHMGGDEVFLPCWQSESTIIEWMKANGMNKSGELDFMDLWSYFQSHALQAWDIASNNSKVPVILWSSDLTDPKNIEKYLDSNRYVIQTWTEATDSVPKELISKGYKIIMSTKNAWYLDHGFWGNTVYHKWNDVYENMILNPSDGVYGGEACMWSEYVSDYNLDSRLWPRVSCLAERLWSNPSTTAQQALPRLLDHSNRLLIFGISPDSLAPEYCRLNDGKC